MALKGVKVLEFVGLAPAPFCGKILADFGASVTRIDKSYYNDFDVMKQGKRTLAVNLKDERGQKLVHQLALKHDVLLEPFRTGVMEKLNLGPERLCRDHPGLIYARLTGFGQSGRLARRAGHDINYLAISGVLSMLGRRHENPLPPINALADFAGGGLMCALGICLALLERHHSGRGQVVDAAMIDGAAYVASFLFMSRSLPIWSGKRGENILDGGAHFYETYETKDGKFMSVGAIEPQFYAIFQSRLGLDDIEQMTSDDETRERVRQAFLQKSQAEWSEIFEDTDACVYPVVDWQDVMQHDHNQERDSFERRGETIIPRPAPRLSRTPGQVGDSANVDDAARASEEALSILRELDVSEDELKRLIDAGVVLLPEGMVQAKL